MNTEKKQPVFMDYDMATIPYLTNPKGIYEVHLIIQPDDQTKLFAFCMDKDIVEKKYINLKPTCALSFHGNYPNQPMLTFWVHGTSAIAVSEAITVALLMEAKSIPVMRLKVEAMATAEEISQLPARVSANYFEFHFKIAIKTKEEWDKLRVTCLPFGVPLFFNPYSKSNGHMQPVITLRRYDVDFKTADNDNNELIKAIVKAGFATPEKIQKEYSIVDTNVYYDEGWLFQTHPKNFIYKL